MEIPLHHTFIPLLQQEYTINFYEILVEEQHIIDLQQEEVTDFFQLINSVCRVYYLKKRNADISFFLNSDMFM